MTPLQEYPTIRQWAYRVFWGVGLVLGAIQVYILTTGGDSPSWLLGAVGVLGYVSIATNYTADRNVAKTTEAETPPEDRGIVG